MDRFGPNYRFGMLVGLLASLLSLGPARADITSNLVGFWKMNEGSGTTTIDSSGNGRTGTLFNTPTWTDGLFAGGLSFNEVDEYVKINDFSYGPNFTVAFWVDFTDNSGSAFQYLFSHGSPFSTDSLNILLVEGSNIIRTVVRDNNDVLDALALDATVALEDTGWHLYTITVSSASGAKVYIDGILQASNGGIGGDAYNPATDIYLARREDGDVNRFYGGRMDDVRIFDRELTAQDVADLAKGYGLFAHWKFDDGSGGTAIESVEGNNGTLQPVGTPPTWTTGNLCGALQFDGTEDYVNVPANATLNVSTDTTITGWFKLDSAFTSATTTSQIIVEKFSNNSKNMLIALVGTDYGQASVSDGSLVFKIEEDGGSARYTWTTRTSWTAGQWYHFAVVLDVSNNANNLIYIDGTDNTAGGTGSGVTEKLKFNADINIGGKDADSGDLTGQRFFAGVIDDIRFYSRALSASDVQSVAARYQVIDLGSLTGQRSLGCKLNAAEEVAGFDSNATTKNSTAWQSRFCVFTTIPTLTGGTVNEALGINTAGKVVGWSDTTGGIRKAIMWTSGGGTTDLGLLTGRTDSEAFAINNNDEVVGNALDFGASPDNRLAFLYLPVAKYGLSMGMNNLGTLGGNQSVAMDLNDSGQVVGGAQTTTLFMEPFIWLPSAAFGLSAGINSLGTLGGINGRINHRAQAINTSGEVVGLSYTAASKAHAFHWQNGTMTDMGLLTGGDTAWAFDINDNGIAVGTANVTGGAFHAFIWDGTTMSDLNSLIDSSLDWTLTRATGINNDREIVGFGTNPSGNIRAFMLVQTCSSSTATQQSLAAFLAQGSGDASPLGSLEQLAVDSAGRVLAELKVMGAVPGEAFFYTVTSPAPGSSGAPGPGTGTLDGFAGKLALGRTLTITTSSTSSPSSPSSVQLKTGKERDGKGDYLLTVGMAFTAEELGELGVEASRLQLHVLDPSRGQWVPAGDDVGESVPTGVLNDSGFEVFTDDSVEFWAVRDDVGIFAVGVPQDRQPDQPDQEGSDEMRSTDDNPSNDLTSEPPSSRPVPPSMCGVGIAPMAIFMAFVLGLVAETRRRH